MKHGAPFTDTEDEYLRLNFIDLDCATMAKNLKRTVSATRSRLLHLGLRKRKQDKPKQTRVTIFFEDSLMPLIKSSAQESDLSMSAFVQETVRKVVQKKSKVA